MNGQLRSHSVGMDNYLELLELLKLLETTTYSLTPEEAYNIAKKFSVALAIQSMDYGRKEENKISKYMIYILRGYIESERYNDDEDDIYDVFDRIFLYKEGDFDYDIEDIYFFMQTTASDDILFECMDLLWARYCFDYELLYRDNLSQSRKDYLAEHFFV